MAKKAKRNRHLLKSNAGNRKYRKCSREGIWRKLAAKTGETAAWQKNESVWQAAMASWQSRLKTGAGRRNGMQ